MNEANTTPAQSYRHSSELNEVIPVGLTRRWIIYRAVPNLLLTGVWTILFFTLLYSLPISIPLYAFWLTALGAALILPTAGQWLRDKLLLKPWRWVYGFFLRFIFAKSTEDTKEITDHLIDKRPLAQQLVDYLRYMLGMRLRADEDENIEIKIRVAKFNARWGAKARFILSAFFLTQAIIFFATTVFHIYLSPLAMIGISVLGIFGGLCASIANDNLLANGLISLAKTSDVKAKEMMNNVPAWDRWLGRVVCMVNGAAHGIACFAVAMKLAVILSSFAMVAANPFITPLFLAFAAFCSLAIAKGYYSLGFKTWLNKKQILKGFFSGTDADGKPVGRIQRIFGVVGSIFLGISVSLAFVMLNGSSFADTMHAPIYSLIGNALVFNTSPAAIIAFTIAGIVGGIGNALIYFCGVFSTSRQIGKAIDNKLGSTEQKSVKFTNPTLAKEVEEYLQNPSNGYHYLQDNLTPKGDKGFLSWSYMVHWRLERNIRLPLIIFFNGIANGVLAALPNALIILAVAPHFVLPVSVTIFTLTMISSMCKDKMNWVPGHENRQHVYMEAKRNLYEREIIKSNIIALRSLQHRLENLAATAKFSPSKSLDAFKAIVDEIQALQITDLNKWLAGFKGNSSDMNIRQLYRQIRLQVGQYQAGTLFELNEINKELPGAGKNKLAQLILELKELNVPEINDWLKLHSKSINNQQLSIQIRNYINNQQSDLEADDGDEVESVVTINDFIGLDAALEEVPVGHSLATYESDEGEDSLLLTNDQPIKAGELQLRATELKRRAEALRDGYDPHIYVLMLTAIVRVLSNLLSVMILPLAMVIKANKAEAKPELATPIKTLSVTSLTGSVEPGANLAESRSQAVSSPGFFQPLPDRLAAPDGHRLPLVKDKVASDESDASSLLRLNSTGSVDLAQLSMSGAGAMPTRGVGAIV